MNELTLDLIRNSKYQLNNLHEQKMPGKKAMLVISNGKSAKENGYLARTEEQLKISGVESMLFDEVEENPLKSTVMAGSTFAKKTIVIL